MNRVKFMFQQNYVCLSVQAVPMRFNVNATQNTHLNRKYTYMVSADIINITSLKFFIATIQLIYE